MSNIIIINTNQNSKKIGRLTPPTSSKKDDYTGYITDSSISEYPVISIKKGNNVPGSHSIKALSQSSALAQLRRIALATYKKVNNLHVSHSNIPVYYETTN